MGIKDMCHYLLNDVAKCKYHYVYLQNCSALPSLGLFCYDQFCSDKALLMKRCVLLLFMDNLFSDLNPRVNISLAGEIFSLQLPLFLSYTQTRIN